MTDQIKLYTRKGDTGHTSLNDGSRLCKADSVFDVLGDLDELNSQIGMLIAFFGSKSSAVVPEIYFRTIQYHIMNISSVVATPGKKGENLTRISHEDISRLEQAIDHCQRLAPSLDQFILPAPKSLELHSNHRNTNDDDRRNQYSLLSAQAHICRSVTRRAERNFLRLLGKERWIDEPCILKYLNRLSDFFFAYSRALIHHLRSFELKDVTMEEMRQKLA